MSNIFAKLQQEGSQQREKIRQQQETTPRSSVSAKSVSSDVASENDTVRDSDVTTSDTDITTSQSDASKSRSNNTKKRRKSPTKQKTPATDSHHLDSDLMTQIISQLSSAKTTTYGTPVRVSPAEKEFFEDFILVRMRKAGIQPRDASLSKLMRFALSYLLLKHEDEFSVILKQALIKKEDSTLFQ